MQRIATTLCIFMLALLAGCTRQQSKPVTLRFWHAWGGYEGQVLQQLVDEFNAAHPNIHVEASQFTIGDKLLASIAGGKPPDIATVWSYMLTPMGESGAFLPLEDHMTSSGYTEESFLPGMWDFNKYGEHRWGVPTTLNVTAIFYIKDTVRRAGLDPDRPPATTDELKLWAQRLLKKDPAGNIQTLGFVPTQYDVWMQRFGGQLFDPETKKFVLNSPENLQALNWMNDLTTLAGGMGTYRRFTAQYGKLDSPSNPLFMGKLAIKEDGQWVIQFFKKFAPTIDYGIFPYPPGKPGVGPGAKIDGSFWAIPVGTKHPDEAWEFLSWLIAPKQNARLCAAWLNIPPMRATLQEPEFIAVRQDPKFDFFVKLLEEGKAYPQPATPVSEQLYDKLTAGCQRVFSGGITAPQMLKELNQDLTDEMDRMTTLMGSGDE